MTEQEYRALPIDSYSSIKVFIEDRKKYYKKYVLGEVVKEDESNSLRMGSLIDCLLLTPSEFENRYTIAVSQVPSGQYGKFIDELVKASLSLGGSTDNFEDIMRAAYITVKYDKNGNVVDFKRDSFEAVKSKFFGTELELYYKERMEANGKIVIEQSSLDTACAVINELKSNFVTSEIITASNTDTFKVFKQFPIIGQIEGSITKSVPFPCKCLIDLLHVDHIKKEIKIYDLKTTWDNENEFVTNYFKYKYYLQGAIYFYLVMEWKKKMKGMEDYAVYYPSYIVAESNNYKNPLIYTTNLDNLKQGMKGFHINGRYHTGVVRAVQDIMWHKEIGIWNISKENYINNGILSIKPFEE